jgi:hypothetical protein
MSGSHRPLPSGDPHGPLSAPFLLQLVFFLGFFVGYVRYGYTYYQPANLKKFLRWSWPFPVAVLLFFGYFFNEAHMPAVWQFLVHTIGLVATQALTTVIVLGLGYGAYRFKLKSKLYYGYLEIMFGSFSAAAVVWRVHFAAADFTNLSIGQGVALVGSAYVVARGLSNSHEARAALANSNRASAECNSGR